MLARLYPTVRAAGTEIINLRAILNLPKGCEHFISDVHGEHEAFLHILNSCSGVLRERMDQLFATTVSRRELDQLATLIYYPAEKLAQLKPQIADLNEWYRITLHRLIAFARQETERYTRSKVRKALPADCAYILEELLYTHGDEADKRDYFENIISTIIEIGQAPEFICAVCELIKWAVVDHLHLVGDIFDRGPRADIIMDSLLNYHSVDIQWGNHDVLWMGAASGSEACIAAVLRNCLAYNNMDILERGYGIPLRPLTLFAEKLYPGLPPEKAALQAVTLMMFKLEGQLIQRNPEFEMEDRKLLHRLDLSRCQIEIDGVIWPVKATLLPTVDPADPYALSTEEENVMAGFRHAFTHSLRLREHIAFLYRRGRMYRAYNGNLLFHGCIPLNRDGSFLQKTLGGASRGGKALLDYADQTARRAFFEGDRAARDFMWYLWCGTDSPVCGRQVKTFARAFIPDEDAWQEPRNAYYDWCNSESKCKEILKEFGLTDDSARIINGHTPIRVTHGESPLKAGGRLVVIDGGFCKAYQKTTGIAGYTLISNSHGMRLMSHQPFTTLRDAQETGRDIHSQSFEFTTFSKRKYVADTDQGKILTERTIDLMRLLRAYRSGIIHLQE
jgi:fructose-1,6-bisphosphatase-3